MFDIWVGEINVSVLVLLISAVIVLPLQLLLCCKVKSVIIRCLPAGLFALLALLAWILYGTAYGWDALIYVYGAVYAVYLLLVCAIGWGIWALMKRKQQK